MTETQQSKQAEIDDLKAQLKAAHESRIEFVEYCRMIENSDFVLMPKDPSLRVLDRLYAEHDIDEERATYISETLLMHRSQNDH